MTIIDAIFGQLGVRPVVSMPWSAAKLRGDSIKKLESLPVKVGLLD